ncbi:Calcium sensing receptor, chloroplastic-like protein [Drosera capensis]
MGSGVLGAGQRVFDVVEKVKPGVDVMVPFLRRAGEEALKVTGPVVVEATKKAGEAIRSAGIDTEPVFTAAKFSPFFDEQFFVILLIICVVNGY